MASTADPVGDGGWAAALVCDAAGADGCPAVGGRRAARAKDSGWAGAHGAAGRRRGGAEEHRPRPRPGRRPGQARWSRAGPAGRAARRQRRPGGAVSGGVRARRGGAVGGGMARARTTLAGARPAPRRRHPVPGARLCARGGRFRDGRRRCSGHRAQRVGGAVVRRCARARRRCGPRGLGAAGDGRRERGAGAAFRRGAPRVVGALRCRARHRVLDLSDLGAATVGDVAPVGAAVGSHRGGRPRACHRVGPGPLRARRTAWRGRPGLREPPGA